MLLPSGLVAMAATKVTTRGPSRIIPQCTEAATVAVEAHSAMEEKARSRSCKEISNTLSSRTAPLRLLKLPLMLESQLSRQNLLPPRLPLKTTTKTLVVLIPLLLATRLTWLPSKWWSIQIFKDLILTPPKSLLTWWTLLPTLLLFLQVLHQTLLQILQLVRISSAILTLPSQSTRYRWPRTSNTDQPLTWQLGYSRTSCLMLTCPLTVT